MRVIVRPSAALILTALAPAMAAAQSDSTPSVVVAAEVAPQRPNGDSGHVLRWWHGAVAAGGLSALMLLDKPVQRYAVHNSGTGADNVAGVVRHFGQPEVYLTIPAGIVATGLLLHRPELTRAGGRIALSLALSAAATEGGKLAFGRPRPENSLDADGYRPFSGQASMPSGHSSMAFALATSLSDEIHRPWATVGLYTAASGVAWSRLNDNRHWLTDVAAGALVGITSAKLASGRWRIFHLRPPTILVTPHGAGFGWQGSF